MRHMIMPCYKYSSPVSRIPPLFVPFLFEGQFVRLRLEWRHSGIVSYFLRDFHRTEMRPAHGAEMRDLGGILG
jgi:hypothetical protein